MPPVFRKDDTCTGHDCFPPRAATSGSPDVFINKKPAHREGDTWVTHSCTHPKMPHGSHDGAMGQGSSSVFVNSKSLARTGDPVSCGSSCGSGSPNVFAGG